MLVLTRRKDEDIIVEHEGVVVLQIKVVDIVQGKVRLGFTGPKTTVVTRKELMAQREKKKNGLER